MSNPHRASGCVSKRFIAIALGCNQRTVENLISEGALQVQGAGVLEAGVALLQEPAHYVTCKACGAKQGQITTKHLQACASLTLKDYVSRWPGSHVLSDVVRRHKAKTEEQKKAQSVTLKARFQRPEGEETRREIAAASRRLMQTPYRSRAAQHLRALNMSPEGRARVSRQFKKAWASCSLRAKVSAWHHKNRQRSLASACNARGYIRRTFSRPHQALETALLAEGVQGLQREHLVRFYRVDEALPDLRLAIEVDGCYWHGCATCGFPGNPVTQNLDRRKTVYLTKRGWTILRIREHDIKADVSFCVRLVLDTMQRLSHA